MTVPQCFSRSLISACLRRPRCHRKSEILTIVRSCIGGSQAHIVRWFKGWAGLVERTAVR
jgi:hypothetical protein